MDIVGCIAVGTITAIGDFLTRKGANDYTCQAAGPSETLS